MLLQENFSLEDSESSSVAVKIASLATNLMEYDVIAFDIFDTMLLRSFAQTDSLYVILEQKMHYYLIN